MPYNDPNPSPLEREAIHLELQGNFTKARSTYERLIEEEGSSRGMVGLGVLLMRGLGGPSDEKRAIELFKASGARGLCYAADAYCQGTGTPVDEEKAVNLYIEALKHGDKKAKAKLDSLCETLTNKKAQFILAGAFRKGVGDFLPQDKPKAIDLYYKLKDTSAVAKIEYRNLTCPPRISLIDLPRPLHYYKPDNAFQPPYKPR